MVAVAAVQIQPLPLMVMVVVTQAMVVVEVAMVLIKDPGITVVLVQEVIRVTVQTLANRQLVRLHLLGQEQEPRLGGIQVHMVYQQVVV
jgi:hypothetical protein